MQRSAFRYLLQHGKNDITSTQEEKLGIIPTLFCQKRSLVTVHYFAVVPITTNIAFSMTLSTLLVIRYFYVNAPELSHFDKRNWHNKIHGLIVIWWFLSNENVVVGGGWIQNQFALRDLFDFCKFNDNPHWFEPHRK